MIKLASFLLLLCISSTFASPFTDNLKQQIMDDDVEITDESLKKITANPVQGSFRKMKVPTKFLSKVMPILARSIKFEHEVDFTAIPDQINECLAGDDTTFSLAIEPTEGQEQLGEDGFKFLRAELYADCTNANLVEMVFFNELFQGEITPIQKIVRETTCEGDDSGSQDESSQEEESSEEDEEESSFDINDFIKNRRRRKLKCITRDVLKTFPREFTPELAEEIKSIAHHMFSEHMMSSL